MVPETFRKSSRFWHHIFQQTNFASTGHSFGCQSDRSGGILSNGVYSSPILDFPDFDFKIVHLKMINILIALYRDYADYGANFGRIQQ